MKIASLAVLTCFGMLVPTLALAQNAPASEAPPSIQPASANPAGTPLICKYYYYNGQILRRRDCRSAHEWERVRYHTQGEIVDYQIRSELQRN
jgi:hypothetical protein